MTKIDLSKFFQNNYDEFVHLRALKNVTDQVDAINAQQDTNITHAQSTADTAQQTATSAKNTADQAQQSASNAETDAKNAKADADTKSAINYQKADGTTVFAPTMEIADIKREDIDSGDTSIGKALMCLDSQNKPIEVGLSNQLLSIQGGMKMFVSQSKENISGVDTSLTGPDSISGHIYGNIIPYLLNGGTYPFYSLSFDLEGVQPSNLSGQIELTLGTALPDYWDDKRVNVMLTIANGSNIVTVPALLTAENTTSLIFSVTDRVKASLSALNWINSGSLVLQGMINDLF